MTFSSQPEAMNVPWIDSPFFPKLVEQTNLDPEMAKIVRFYAEHGYVVIDTGLSDSLMEGAVRDLAGKYRADLGFAYADAKRVMDGWIVSENIRQIANAPRIIETLRALYQRRPIPFQTLNFCLGSEQRTHSDRVHFDSIPYGYMCGVWTALEDVDHKNGPLHYYPMSQKLPFYSLHDIGVVGSFQSSAYENYVRYEDFVEELMIAEKLERVEIKIKRGQALIWAANLFHGGQPILDHDRTRYSQVTHYYFEGCLYYTPLMSDPALGKMYVRKVFDVTSGGIIPQYYNGLMIENPGDWPPKIIGDPSGESLLKVAAMGSGKPSTETREQVADIRARAKALRTNRTLFNFWKRA